MKQAWQHALTDLITDLLEHVFVVDHSEIIKDRRRCDEIIARDSHIPRELILDLLIRLFPRIRRLYHPDIAFYHSDATARKLRRICSPDLFDAYFRLSMQTGQLPLSEFETILEVANNEKAFDHLLNELNQDDRITQFLDQLDSTYLNDIPIEHIQTIISALLDNGDLFPQGVSGLLSLDTPLRIHRIIHRLLHRFENSEDRYILLQKGIGAATKSLYILIHELNEQALEHYEESDTFMPLEFRDLSTEQLDLLRQLTVKRIETWAHNGSLVTHPHLLSILMAWQAWGNPEDCYRYVREITQTDRGLLAILTAAFDKAIAQAMTVYEINPAWKMYLEDINVLIATREIEGRARALFENNYFEKLKEQEQLALMIFLDLLNVPTRKLIPKTTV